MYLGIDLGTSSVKSVLMDSQQNVLASASASLSVNRPRSGWSEQDPKSWWQATCKTLDSLSNSHRPEFSQIKGIGLSGQMHGATLLDKDDNILRPAILWNDTRSAKQCAEIETSCPASRDISGNLAMPGFTSPKILWIKQHEPEIFARIAKVLLPKDYLRLCLTGEYVSEMSDAAGTLWLDVANRKWSDELLNASGLNQHQMPSLLEGSEISGELKPALQSRWRIKQTVFVAGGAGDNAAAACGMGVVNPTDAFISIGTSGVLFVCNDKFSPNTERAVHAFCHALPETWHQMGVILSASDSLQWLANLSGKSSAMLTSELAEINTPSSTIFLPYLGGERTPHNDADIRGAFIGLDHSHGTQALTQSILEGVAFAFKDCHNALLQAGSDFDAAFAVGGGAQSNAWLTIISSVLDKPLLIPEGGELGAAFGAARLGMAAVENMSAREVCHAPQVSKIVEPSKILTNQYAEKYQRFKTLYPALKN